MLNDEMLGYINDVDLIYGGTLIALQNTSYVASTG